MKLLIKTLVILSYFSLLKTIPSIIASEIEYYQDVLWVKVENFNNTPIDSTAIYTNNECLNSLLQTYGVFRFSRTFPYSKNELLLRVYEIEFTGELNDFIDALNNNCPEAFASVIKVPIEELVVLYDPSDYMWQEHPEWLWHLTSIEADKAWDITKGNENIKIAIIDTWFDINHPDLADKLTTFICPYSNVNFSSDCTKNHHGTTVASFAAAHTDGGGQLSSIGFNSMIIPILTGTTGSTPLPPWEGNFIARAHFASLSLNANVLTSSAGGWRCCDPLNINCNYSVEWMEIEQAAVKEILDNGTVIVMPAGNGVNKPIEHCHPSGFTTNYPWFPLHPYYDDRIIIVSSVGEDDKHYFFNNDVNEERTHSHYPEVDLCAPGYLITGAEGTEKKVNNDCEPNTYPYFNYSIGTSFSTPIVAGTAALILSVDPCLEPYDVKLILKSTTDPILDAANYPNGVGTGKLNAYEAVKMAQTYGEYEPITSTVNWNEEKYVKGTLTIKANGHLTVTNKVRFAKDAKIVVEQGGKLTLDGAHLTNSNGCKSLWEGIEVWGNRNLMQNSNNQGHLIVKNGSVIENAKNAVTLWKPGDWLTTGGIIQASNSTFRNNRRAVEFLYYQFELNGQVARNISYFENCDFYVDKKLLDDIAFSYFITMWRVNNIRINGCRFENRDLSIESNRNGIGIYVIDASFQVNHYCSPFQICDCETTPKSEFINLNYGIKAIKSQMSYSYKIQNTIFKDNIIGIGNYGVDFFQITFNQFSFDGVTWFGTGMTQDPHAQISIRKGSGFLITENSFFNSQGLERIGIYLEETFYNNEIYKNSFLNFHAAFVTHGWNAGYSQNYYGLKILCNDIENTHMSLGDIIVTSSRPGSGIHNIQGVYNNNQLFSAGNKFTINPFYIKYHFYNVGNLLKYYHTNSPRSEPVDVYDDGVTIIKESNNVLDHACNAIVACDGSFFSIAGPEDDFYFHSNELLNHTTNYNNLIDNGNTEAWVSTIENATTQDATQIYNDLMIIAPWVSVNVLVAVVESEIFDDIQIKNLLTSNPDATFDKGFIDFLENFPGFDPDIIEDVKYSWGNQTIRTEMELSISYHSRMRSRNGNFLVSHYMNDTSAYTKIDSIIYWLNEMDDLNSNYTLVESYLLADDISTATQILDNIPVKFDLSGFMLDEHNYLSDWYGILMDLSIAELSIYDMNQGQETTAVNIADSSEGRAGMLAQNLLNWAYEYDYNYEIYLPEEVPELFIDENIEGSTFVLDETEDDILHEFAKQILIYPNPADEHLQFDFQLFHSDLKIFIQITDLNGRIIENFVSNQKEMERSISLNTSLWEPGMYFYRILMNDKLAKTGKVVIQR